MFSDLPKSHKSYVRGFPASRLASQSFPPNGPWAIKTFIWSYHSPFCFAWSLGWASRAFKTWFYHLQLCLLHFLLEHHAWSVGNHSSWFPEQRVDSCLKGFVHHLWPTWRTPPCHPSMPMPSPFWPVASPLPELGSVLNTLGSLPWQQPRCGHWAELCAFPLWPGTPGFSLAQLLDSVGLDISSVCLCFQTVSLASFISVCLVSKHSGVSFCCCCWTDEWMDGWVDRNDRCFLLKDLCGISVVSIWPQTNK